MIRDRHTRHPERERRAFDELAGLGLVLALVLLISLPACGGGGGGFDETRDVIADFEEEGGGYIEPVDEIFDPPGGFVPDSAREDQVKALARANWFRHQSGLPYLDMIEGINQAAQAHCDYYVLHKDKYNSTGLSVHDENPAWAEGFTGAAFWERCAHFGYHDAGSEVIAFLHHPEQSVDGWMNTLYHRIPFMNANMTACGYGAAGSGGWQNGDRIDTIDFGRKDADGNTYDGPPVEGIYPPPGSSGIPPSFDGLESPQPPPPPTGYPSGTIITVTWSKPTGFKVDEHDIWAEDDQVELPVVWLDGNNDSNLAGANTIAMYAHQPLKKATKYWVHIKGEKGGKDWEKTWYFWTEKY